MTSPKGRILCTEDDADTRDLLSYVLTDRGYEIICTDSADKAIHLAKTKHFDPYLLDNWMPGLSAPDGPFPLTVRPIPNQ